MRTYESGRVTRNLLKRSRHAALLHQDQAEELRRGGGDLGGYTHWRASVGSGAAAARQLQVELALATRKLDAGSDHSGIRPRRSGVRYRGVVDAAQSIQTIQATVHRRNNLWRSAKAQLQRTPSKLTAVQPPRFPATQ